MGNYLVTGAAGGMGRAICDALTTGGHRVWGLDRAVTEAAEGWTSLAADLTRAPELECALEQIRAEAGALDGIVHAAGVYDLDSLVEMPEDAFVRDFDVNLFGAFRINRLFLPLLRRGGRIVLITSELAPLHPLPFTGIYAVTKAALDRYAEALRMEVQLLGISVIVLRPGAVRTGMLSVSTEKLERFCEKTQLYPCNAARFRQIVDRIEARSVPPERVAALICHALSTPRPRLCYSLNRNPLLLLFELCPVRLRLFLIRKILEDRNG